MQLPVFKVYHSKSPILAHIQYGISSKKETLAKFNTSNKKIVHYQNHSGC